MYSVVVLAAGYGSRFQEGIISSDNTDLKSYLHLPKTLYPLCGIPLLDYWHTKICQSDACDLIKDVFIVTNQRYYATITQWAQTRGINISNVVNNKKHQSDDEQTELSDLKLLLSVKASELDECNLIVVAGDTIVDEHFTFSDLLRENSGDNCSLVCHVSSELVGADYVHTSGASVLKISKEKSLDNIPDLVLNTIYTLPTKSRGHLDAYLSGVSLNELSQRSHGDFIQWLISSKRVAFMPLSVQHCFDIDTVDTYFAAERYFAEYYSTLLSDLPSQVTESCPARVGLMGNPSDGFNGKTVSFTVNNFHAQVFITANADSRNRDVDIVPHSEFDQTRYSSMDHLYQQTLLNGYYGGQRLLQATCKAFAQRCSMKGLTIHMQRGFRMSYDSNIPRRVGLSGSSAIIVAAYRALMKFYGVQLDHLGIAVDEFPQVILDIENEELGITAGLQDRVIQTYGGLVHMDFTQLPLNKKGVYTSLDPVLLPEFYLAYNIEAGGDSGKVHSSVRERWNMKDRDVCEGFSTLGDLADQARDCLQSGDRSTLASLMDKNFSLRRRIYGDEVVGEHNIRVVQLANDLGFAAKFTGSGGAILCLLRDGSGWMLEESERHAVDAFRREGFKLVRIIQ